MELKDKFYFNNKWESGVTYTAVREEGGYKICVVGGEGVYSNHVPHSKVKDFLDEGDWIIIEDIDNMEPVEDPSVTVATSEWTANHYDVNYTLSEKEIEQGFIRLDTYKVNKAWGINAVDPTGAGFHCLKTLNRIPRQKNTLERELRALIGQVKCWANEEAIDLSDIVK
jgi:hypothetical protein